MARRKEPNQADETLHQIEESFDKVAHWVSEKRIPLAIAAAVILAVAAGSDMLRSQRASAGNEGAAALAEVRTEFLAAMGAEPGALVFAEPANPAVAREARDRFAKEFEAVGREHEGSAASAMALLEAGNLHEQLGAPHLARDDWEAGLASAGSGTNLEALVLRRLARAQEDAGEWSAAAESHERAGRNSDYPGHWDALAAAARCRLEAGEIDAALALLAELENGEVLDRIAPPTVARLREARASRDLDSAGADS
ncbi:MAG: hypothetical protein JRH10_04420 [Deltaproteobacteria bacterium]|nr:hypothetical protein [Deltaproteobacteria bacterium]MBW2447146.1 hypothetical protein [Deltaproteobacteria bacterium]